MNHLIFVLAVLLFLSSLTFLWVSLMMIFTGFKNIACNDRPFIIFKLQYFILITLGMCTIYFDYISFFHSASTRLCYFHAACFFLSFLFSIMHWVQSGFICACGHGAIYCTMVNLPRTICPTITDFISAISHQLSTVP